MLTFDEFLTAHEQALAHHPGLNAVESVLHESLMVGPPHSSAKGLGDNPNEYHRHDVHLNGHHIATIDVHKRRGHAGIDFETIHNSAVSNRGPSSVGPILNLGPSHVRQGIRQVLAYHPDIKTYSGDRATGAKADSGEFNGRVRPVAEMNEEHEHGDFIRDEHGKPISHYHGTRQAFDHFKPAIKPKMQHGFGMHFTTDPNKAEHYTKKEYSKGNRPNIHHVHLRANNVLDADQFYHKDTHPNHYKLHLALYKGTGRKAIVSKLPDTPGHFVINPDATNPARAQKIIQDHGFDALKYTARETMNTGYGRRNADKYPAISVFHPGQIHPAHHKITEDEYWDRPKNIKGWMSPSGDAHLFHSDSEHRHNHHPDYIKQGGQSGDSLQQAQANGFVRFGVNANSIHGKHHFIHYDDTHPKGRATALKALQYMKPDHNAEVTVSGRGGLFKNGKVNQTTRSQLGQEAVVTPAKAAELIRGGKNTKPHFTDLRKHTAKLMGKTIEHPLHGKGTIDFVGVSHASMTNGHRVDAKFLRQHGHIK